MKPQFPVNLRITLSQGCHISYNLVTTLPFYTRLLLCCYNLVRFSTGCDNLGISVWEPRGVVEISTPYIGISYTIRKQWHTTVADTKDKHTNTHNEHTLYNIHICMYIMRICSHNEHMYVMSTHIYTQWTYNILHVHYGHICT